jgi:hypothetical protein
MSKLQNRSLRGFLNVINGAELRWWDLRLEQLEASDPADVCGSPGSFSSIANFISQQQRFELLASAKLRAHRILTCTHLIAHRLVMLTIPSLPTTAISAEAPSSIT